MNGEDNDDARSVCTVAPRELESVVEEEEQMMR